MKRFRRRHTHDAARLPDDQTFTGLRAWCSFRADISVFDRDEHDGNSGKPGDAASETKRPDRPDFSPGCRRSHVDHCRPPRKRSRDCRRKSPSTRAPLVFTERGEFRQPRRLRILVQPASLNRSKPSVARSQRPEWKFSTVASSVGRPREPPVERDPEMRRRTVAITGQRKPVQPNIRMTKSRRCGMLTLPFRQ